MGGRRRKHGRGPFDQLGWTCVSLSISSLTRRTSSARAIRRSSASYSSCSSASCFRSSAIAASCTASLASSPAIVPSLSRNTSCSTCIASSVSRWSRACWRSAASACRSAASRDAISASSSPTTSKWKRRDAPCGSVAPATLSPLPPPTRSESEIRMISRNRIGMMLEAGETIRLTSCSASNAASARMRLEPFSSLSCRRSRSLSSQRRADDWKPAVGSMCDRSAPRRAGEEAL